MRLTTDHPQSSYGIPIFMDAKNNPVDYRDGINWIKKSKNLNSQGLADKLGLSRRTVEDWCAGQMPSKVALLLIKNVFKM